MSSDDSGQSGSSFSREYIQNHERKPSLEDILRIEREIQAEVDEFQRRLKDAQLPEPGVTRKCFTY